MDYKKRFEEYIKYLEWELAKIRKLCEYYKEKEPGNKEARKQIEAMEFYHQYGLIASKEFYEKED